MALGTLLGATGGFMVGGPAGAVIGAGLGDSLFGGSNPLGGLTGENQADAALKAAKLQYQAAQEAMKQQREMFDILNQQQAPYRQAGYTSLNALNALMGLPPAYSTQGPAGVPGPVGAPGPVGMAPGMTGPYHGVQPMQKPVKPGIQPGQMPASMYTRGGGAAAPAAMAAAPASGTTRGFLSNITKPVTHALGSAVESIAKPVMTGGLSLVPGSDKIPGMIGKIPAGGLLAGGGLGITDPIMGGLLAGKVNDALGGGAGGLFGSLPGQLLNQLANAPAAAPAALPATPAPGPMISPGYQAGEGLAGFGALTRPFGAADLQTQLAPNYQFMLQQGLGATRQGQNVTGGGSNMQRAATKFAEDYASNAYQQALQNYVAQQQSIYNRLSGIAGIGQTAQNQQQALGQNTANALSQLGIGGASALGAGQVGAANAQAGALQNLLGLGTLAFLA